MRDDPLSDERPRPRTAHTLGEDLSALSTDELDARVALLEAEIARLKADRARKESHRSAAAAAFKL
jgi:uncharacterized small protein (DUF1192 family)